ncbi:MAG: hypothetical protein IPK20_15675 [Betaproteobacteria bacterium]|nr:hypothetical protein [Betaproteobacteria bacterium]
MNWFKVIVGFAVMFGVIFAWVRIMSKLRGEASGPMFKMEFGKRSRKKDDAASNELEQIIAAHRAGVALPAAAATPAPTPAALETPPEQRPLLAKEHARPAPEPVLAGPQKVLYLACRTAFPELIVFPRLPAAQLLGTAAMGAVAQHVFDAVLCRPDYTPLAVIDMGDPHNPSQAAQMLLRERGVRYLEFDRRSLPRREQLRDAVQGL